MVPDTQLQQTSGFDYMGSLFTVLLSLAVIIILIVLFIKLLSRKNKMWQMNQSIRTLGGTGLGQNKSLQVVEVGDVVYLLGVGEDITLIDKVSDPEQVAHLLSTFERVQVAQGALPVSVSAWIKQLRNKRRSHTDNAAPHQEETDSSSVSFHEMLHAKLEKQPDRSARVERLLNDNTKEDR
ncbi:MULTISPECIES: flagellar biosynthetic protein FliO [unclassified Paenibacillus]|uniref:flagellar biosynthetic protein FliO n=1 Tax=unclassified Paenibacillus TaxID=185978 RepID=UPI001EF43C94|nr:MULTISPECIES: flagellar biosynthetic protein FliO [unclassified Paenibacillus]MDK8180719.1 flagellar biosynthetic protein FliO [Paenibacillus sp. UMB4589-SE434]